LSDIGSLLPELRRTPTFVGVPTVPWQVFVAVALHLRGNAEAWPSQETLGRFCGYAARTVRSGIAELERLDLLRVRRDRDRDGLDHLRYSPGPATLRELAGMRERRSAAPDPRSARPEPRSGDLLTTKELLVVDGEAAGEDQAVARVALGEHFERRCPGRRAPRVFDDTDVERVARCAAAVEGDEETKLRTLRDAIEGAFRASNRAPTVRFIWERLEHFLAHAERGQRARARKEPAAVAVSTRVPAGVRAPLPAEGHLTPARMDADLEKVFGPNWRTRR
jgi:hypothetical protein